ncbi:MAG: hypothetical protein AAF226_09230, partial [Verrucomicrobiota bacterium]
QIAQTTVAPDQQLQKNSDAAFIQIDDEFAREENGAWTIPLLAQQNGKTVCSLALLSVLKHWQVDPTTVVAKFAGVDSEIQIPERKSIPISADGRLRISLYSGLRNKMQGSDGGLAKTSITVDEIAFTGKGEDVVAQKALEYLKAEFDSLSSNLIVIGLDRRSDRTMQSSTGDFESITSLTADAIATIQSGRYITWWERPLRWIVAGVLLVFGLVLLLIRPKKGFFVGLILAFVALIVAVVSFRFTLSWTPPFFILGLLALWLLFLLVTGRKKETSLSEIDLT